jgi:hypothetical protein
MRIGNSWVYQCSGRSTKKRRNEAKRCSHLTILLGLEDLVKLVVPYDESFDINGRVVIPLLRIRGCGVIVLNTNR